MIASAIVHLAYFNALLAGYRVADMTIVYPVARGSGPLLSSLAAVLLLVAIVAAIALTMRKRKDTKYQDPAKQVIVKRADRIRLVTMPAEKE